MNKSQALLASALLGGALTALGATPASATKLYYSYSNPGYNSAKATSNANNPYFGDDFSCVKPDGTLASGCSTTSTGQTHSPYSGYNLPTPITELNHSSYFTNWNNPASKAGKVGEFQQTFLEVDPITCMKGGSGTGQSCNNTGSTSGIEKNDITTSFFFSLTGSTPSSSVKGITINVSALASFDYAHQTDSFCWDASKMTSSATLSGATIVENKQVAGKYSCSPGALPNGVNPSVTDFGFEEIIFQLAGNYFEVNLYNWFDWNMTPQITFAQIDPHTVPEPASVTLLGAGLLGFGAFIRRRKKAA